MGEWRERCWRYLYGGGSVVDGYLWYYVPEVAEVLKSNIDQYLAQIGRGLRPRWFKYTARTRTRPHYNLWPMLRVGFYVEGRRVYGSTNSPLRVYLNRGVMRITLPLAFEEAAYLVEKGWLSRARTLMKGRYVVRAGRKHVIIEVPLKPSVLGELRRLANLRCEFVAQIVSKHRPSIHLIARRKAHVEVRLPLLVLGVDVNSRYGLVVRGLEVTRKGVRLVLRKRYKPPNHGYREKIAAELQSLGRYREANAVRRREKSLNEAWEKGVVGELRGVIRSYVEREYTVIVAVDKPDPESLKGTQLQRTLLRVIKRLKWMAHFEGALLLEVRASGRYCPLCGERGLTVPGLHRAYYCPTCHLVWQRDSAAALIAVLQALCYLKRYDYTERFYEWLWEVIDRNQGIINKI